MYTPCKEGDPEDASQCLDTELSFHGSPLLSLSHHMQTTLIHSRVHLQPNSFTHTHAYTHTLSPLSRHSNTRKTQSHFLNIENLSITQYHLTKY